jgi:acetylornithine deacetylase/succinyl-diaminopimelate desuccinylase-like protein
MSQAPFALAAARVSEFLLAQREAQQAFLAAMVRQPSDNPPGDCAPHAQITASCLEGLGLRVERHVVPAAEVAAAGMRSCTNLIVRQHFGSASADAPGTVLALNAHGDVVPPGSGWSVDPYAATVRDGVMLGRGVAVSKSDFASYVWVMLALREAARAGAPLQGTLELHLTYDEEAGGNIGPAWLLRQGLTRPDLVLCAGFSYGIVTAHNGALHLEIELLGRSAHAAEPASGVDALEAATALMGDLYRIRKGYATQHSAIDGIDSPSLVIGLIQGGINTNVVPDKVVLRIDRRIIPEEQPERVERLLQAQVASCLARWPGIRYALRRILLAQPFVPAQGQARLVQVLQRQAQQILGQPIPSHGVPIYTDARHYAAAGIPTVLYGAGPRSLRDGNGHGADEQLRLHDLFAATEIVARSALQWLGVNDA